MNFLVLSGGGARALAHIGAIKALQEQELSFDAILGVSMGALIGAGYAILRDAKKFEIIAKNALSKFKMKFNMGRFTPGSFKKLAVYLGCWYMNKFKSAPVIHRKIRIIDKLFGNMRFEDLEIKLYVLLADLKSGEGVVISSGKLAEVIKASMAIPGIIPPQLVEEREYSDGGTVNNLPVRIAKKLGADFVAAFDAGKKDATISSKTANAYLLKIDAYRERKSAEIEEKMADIYVDYDLDDIDSLDFSKGRWIIDWGYEKTKEVLRERW